MDEQLKSVTAQPDRRIIFVVHGRDEAARSALFSYLRDLDLHPLEWEELVHNTGSVSPFTGEAVAAAFSKAQAVVVLLTPDDQARLHEELQGVEEPDYEIQLTGQPRPNVLLEAGMALGHQPSRTIFVEIGHLRPVSDLTGRNVIRLNGTAEPLNALAGRLEAAGCQVNRANSRYLDGARFSDLSALDRGSQYVATTDARNVASLRVRLRHQGASGYLFEVRNEGSSVLEDVHWILPESASNWRLSTNMLTDYPIRAMQPEEVISVPVMISTGGPSMVIAELVARTSNGDSLNLRKRLSVFDSNGLEWR